MALLVAPADACGAFERARLSDPERARVEEATAAMVAGDRKKSEAGAAKTTSASSGGGVLSGIGPSRHQISVGR